MKILNQTKVKLLTGKLPHHCKLAETSNYAKLTMKKIEVALETTLASRRANNRALKVRNHE